MSTDGRIPVGLQLAPGKDDDLIAWFDTTKKGEAGRLIKDLMRLALFGKLPPAAEQLALSRLQEEMNRRLADMQSQLEEMRLQLQNGVRLAPESQQAQVSQGLRAEDTALAARSHNLLKQKW